MDSREEVLQLEKIELIRHMVALLGEIAWNTHPYKNIDKKDYLDAVKQAVSDHRPKADEKGHPVSSPRAPKQAQVKNTSR